MENPHLLVIQLKKRCSCFIDTKHIAKLKAGLVNYQPKLIHIVPLLVQFPPWFNLYFAKYGNQFQTKESNISFKDESDHNLILSGKYILTTSYTLCVSLSPAD